LKRIKANFDLIHFIFACFGIVAYTIYSHQSLQNIRTNFHTNIQFDAKQIHFEAFFASEQIFASTFSPTGEYSLQNICFEANIHKTSSEIYIQMSTHSLANIRIQANVCFQIFAYKRMFASEYLHTSD
jgi:hypothetical protein